MIARLYPAILLVSFLVTSCGAQTLVGLLPGAGGGIVRVLPLTGGSSPVTTLGVSGLRVGVRAFDSFGRRYFEVSSNALFSVDLLSGAVSQVPVGSLGDIQFDPTAASHGKLYGVTTAAPLQVVSIDLATGQFTTVAPFGGTSLVLASGAYDSSTHRYFVYADTSLYVINTQTGAVSSAPAAARALNPQFDSSNGFVFGEYYNGVSPNGSAEIVKVDLSTGALSAVATIATGSFSFSVSGAAYDSIGHRYFAFSSGNVLTTVNTQTHAVSSVVASASVANLQYVFLPAVDPVPDLLSGAAITRSLTAAGAPQGQPYLADLTRGRAVVGVAADGAAQIVLRIPASTAGQVFTIRVRSDQCAALQARDCVDEYGFVFDPANPPQDVFANNQLSSVDVTAVATGSGPIAFAVYRAPADFVRSGAPNTADQAASQRPVYLSLNGGAEADLPVTVVRPPVVLIHGVWSDRTAWDFFRPLTDALTHDSRFSIAWADYSATNFAGFAGNAAVVLPQVIRHIRAFRDASQACQGCAFPRMDVAAVRADVIAHSMGGNVTRSFVLNPGFQRAANYKMGYVHKLITVDTPYTGSPFAAALQNLSSFCKSIFEIASGRTIGNAVVDLAPQSAALNALLQPRFGIAAHAVVGVASQAQVDAAESSLAVRLTNYGCGLLPLGHFSDLLGFSSDLIVARDSQAGIGIGVTAAAPPGHVVPGIVHSVDGVLFAVGPDSLSHGINGGTLTFLDSGNGQRAIDLLNSTVKGSDFEIILP